VIFYFDEMMPRKVAAELVKGGHQVVMAVDAGMAEKDDLIDHLPYAAQRGAVLVTADRSFAGRAAKLANHSGVVCWTGSLDNTGGIIKALIRFAEQHQAESTVGQVYWLK
jgi:predicted nuclease of predicted toxin-antitoxin system